MPTEPSLRNAGELESLSNSDRDPNWINRLVLQKCRAWRAPKPPTLSAATLYESTITTTRRFWARPSRVSFGATGASWP